MQPTVGIDFISKTLYYDDKAVKLQLWDTAGQERFRSLIPNYIRDCTVAILVYDITCKSISNDATNLQLDETSFNNLSKWVEDVRNERGSDAILVIVGNKTDLEEKRFCLATVSQSNNNRAVTTERAEAFARENETLYMEVSAKAGINIHNLFQSIASILPGNENNRVFMTENSKKHKLWHLNLNQMCMLQVQSEHRILI